LHDFAESLRLIRPSSAKWSEGNL